MERWLLPLIIMITLFVGALLLNSRKRYARPLTQDDLLLSERLATYAPAPVPRSTPIPAFSPSSHPSPPPRAEPRNPPLSLETYQNMVIWALAQDAVACLPIDPAYLADLEAWALEAEADISMELVVTSRGSTGKMARVIVSPGSPTGPHRALHYP